MSSSGLSANGVYDKLVVNKLIINDNFTPIIIPDALWKSQIEAQNKFAALFKGAKHVTNTNASHYIHRTQPQLVIDSIREVVDQVRSASESHP